MLGLTKAIEQGTLITDSSYIMTSKSCSFLITFRVMLLGLFIFKRESQFRTTMKNAC